MQCTFGKCRTVGYMDEQQEFTLKTEHAHLPSPSKIQAKKFATEVREKAANTGNAPRQIVVNAQIDLPLYAAPTIPNLTLPIGTFSIGCSAVNLARTMHWRHGMAASINLCRQSTPPSQADHTLQR